MCIGWLPCMIFIAGIYESFTITYISWLLYIHDIHVKLELEPKCQRTNMREKEQVKKTEWEVSRS